MQSVRYNECGIDAWCELMRNGTGAGYWANVGDSKKQRKSGHGVSYKGVKTPLAIGTSGLG